MAYFDFESVFDYHENKEFTDLSVDSYSMNGCYIGNKYGGYAVQNARHSDIENAISEYNQSNEWN